MIIIGSSKKSFEEIKKFVEENSDCELLSETYEGTFEPLLFRCRCGAEFQASWHKFSSQGRRSCVRCALEERNRKRRRPMDVLKSQVEATGCEYISGDFKNQKSKIVVKCRCGHNRTVAVSYLLSDSFSGLCKECSYPMYHGVNRLSLDEVREMSAARGLELLSTEYHNAREKLKFRCACGQEFETTWDSVVSKNKAQCDRCGWRESFGERQVSEWLEKNDFKFEREKGFPGLVGPTGRQFRFDFYIPEKNLCIEVDGQQHSKIVNYSGKEELEKLTAVLWATQLRDWQKTCYCQKAGIDLLRINYTDFDRVSEILTDKLIPR